MTTIIILYFYLDLVRNHSVHTYQLQLYKTKVKV